MRTTRVRENTASLATGQPLFAIFSIFLVAVAAMDDDGHLLRDIKEETVAHHLATMACDNSLMDDSEEIGAQTLNGKTAGVVVKVALPVVQLPFAEENLVVVARLEEASTC